MSEAARQLVSTWKLKLNDKRRHDTPRALSVSTICESRVVGQFQNFAPVLELSRNGARIAKTKSELGAQRPALHSSAETYRNNAGFKMKLSTLSLWLVAALPVLTLSLIACDQLKLTHYQ